MAHRTARGNRRAGALPALSTHRPRTAPGRHAGYRPVRCLPRQPAAQRPGQPPPASAAGPPATADEQAGCRTCDPATGARHPRRGDAPCCLVDPVRDQRSRLPAPARLGYGRTHRAATRHAAPDAATGRTGAEPRTADRTGRQGLPIQRTEPWPGPVQGACQPPRRSGTGQRPVRAGRPRRPGQWRLPRLRRALSAGPQQQPRCAAGTAPFPRRAAGTAVRQPAAGRPGTRRA